MFYNLTLRQDDNIIPRAATEEEEEQQDGFIIQINVLQIVNQPLTFFYPKYRKIPRKYDSQLFHMERDLLIYDNQNLQLFISNILSDVLMPMDYYDQFGMAVMADLIGDKYIPVFSQQGLSQLVSIYAWLMTKRSRNAGRRLLPLVMDFKVEMYHRKGLLLGQSRGECSICLEELPQVVVQLYCSHRFHEDCIVRWQENSRFCPICKSPC